MATTMSELVMSTPVGPLLLRSNGAAITHALFVDDAVTEDEPTPLLADARRQFEEYFAGDRDTFDLPLQPTGTDFQKRVWSVLTTIPYGATTSYGKIAAELGMPPGASRAVGLANGANPIAIAVPCHRVIGANGKLIGYAGGLPRKKYLLDFESRRAQQALFGS